MLLEMMRGCSELRTSLRTKFRLTGKLTGNFAESGRPSRFSCLIQRADSIVYGRIPCGTEQGIFKCVSGNFFEEQGNLIYSPTVPIAKRSDQPLTSTDSRAFRRLTVMPDSNGWTRVAISCWQRVAGPRWSGAARPSDRTSYFAGELSLEVTSKVPHFQRPSELIREFNHAADARGGEGLHAPPGEGDHERSRGRDHRPRQDQSGALVSVRMR
jgi:hypothetical protein